MAGSLVIYGFETSNNMKVRVALGYKKIPYRFQRIDPAERGEIRQMSGQHLTPVMVHQDRVLFDSAAILRYLEANFLDTPRIFGTSLTEQWKIEDWELFARVTLAGPLMQMVHHKIGGGAVDEEMNRRCNSDMGAATEHLIEGLQDREWLVGDSLSAADITAAAVIYRVRGSDLLTLPQSASSLDGWVKRVMSFDSELPV